MDLKKFGVNMRNWVDSAQDRVYWKALVNAALNPDSISHRISSNSSINISSSSINGRNFMICTG